MLINHKAYPMRFRASKPIYSEAENGPTTTFPSKLIQAHEMGAPALHKALNNLIKKDLIHKGEDKKYCIIDNFVSEWIRMLSKNEDHFPS
jgi:hypothetical protein